LYKKGALRAPFLLVRKILLPSEFLDDLNQKAHTVNE